MVNSQEIKEKVKERYAKVALTHIYCTCGRCDESDFVECKGVYKVG
jgi:hypothetical protein